MRCTHLVVVLDGLPEPVVLVVGGEDLGEEAEEGGVGDGRLLAEQERLVAQVLGKGLKMRKEERGVLGFTCSFFKHKYLSASFYRARLKGYSQVL